MLISYIYLSFLILVAIWQRQALYVNKQIVNFFEKCLKFYIKITLSEALDFLEQLDSETEDEVTKIFFEPPENDGYISGEDDATEEEGGIPDDVCPSQLKSNCEIVFKGGQRLGSNEDIGENDSNNNQTTSEDVVQNSVANSSESVNSQQKEACLKSIAPKTPLFPLTTIDKGRGW